MPNLTKDRLSLPFLELGIRVPDLNPVLDAYEASHRFYHNFDHVSATISLLHALNFASPEAEIALIYHDVVYDTHSNQNESDSAEWAVRDLRHCGATAQTIESIANAILTTDHKTQFVSELQAQVADVDLAILAADDSNYRTYAQSIRREYQWVSEHEYFLGRSSFLTNMLKKPAIFHTDICRIQFTDSARANMKWELNELSEAARRRESSDIKPK